MSLHSESANPVGVPLADTGAAGGSGQMFDRIAGRYDLVNRLMTFGIDQSWRRLTVDRLQLQAGQTALDLATGTADLAILLAKRVPGTNVVGVDPSKGMLAVGRTKVAAQGLADRITLQEGDACQLPFADATMDGITMGFGIRNVTDRPRALREMARVLRPGARVAILEATEPQGGPMAWGAKFHLRVIVPTIGRMVSGGSEYRYLQQSIAVFPPAGEFANLMRAAGLEVEATIPLMFGATHLWVGRKPAGQLPA
jgi:demethylmenaquinone methyltransferase/2-methoxy-6-polyprenyl-1,4-benzoquinol methylase